MKKKIRKIVLTQGQKAHLRTLRRVHRLLVPRAVQWAIDSGWSCRAIPLPSERRAAVLHRTIAMAEATPSISVFVRDILDNQDPLPLLVVHQACADAAACVTNPTHIGQNPPAVPGRRDISPPDDRQTAIQILRWYAVATSPHPDDPTPPKSVAMRLRQSA